MAFHRHAPLLLCLMLAASVRAQLLPQAVLDTVRTFRSLERALQEPDSVYRLDLSRQGLKEVPGELRRLKNLNALDLGRNKLRSLPAWMNELLYMQEFSAGRNKFMEVPQAVCQWKALKRLDLHQNSIQGLPACMGGLKQLHSLDLWSNELGDFPAEIAGMKALRFVDLRVIQFSQSEMDRISALFPTAKIWFSQPCDCGE